jgi:hypothetical protein
MRILLAALAMAAFTILWALPASADDWEVVKLRGTVLELVDGAWLRLERGDIVPDDRVIRTLGGRATLVRGAETIDLGSNTQIQIFDKEARRPFTTVKQHFGTVEIEAEVRDVQHFAVETPYLVAVVKGTRFVVTSDENASEVSVGRGAVEVTGTGSDTHAVILAGQSAGAAGDAPLKVAGRGNLPAVVDAKGNPVTDAGNNGNGNANGGGNGLGVGAGSGNGQGIGVNAGNGVGANVNLSNVVSIEIGLGND